MVQADRRGLTNGCILAVADALQIVYSEALYESYGLRRKEIATLFAVGYASSLCFGTFFAAAADYMLETASSFIRTTSSCCLHCKH